MSFVLGSGPAQRMGARTVRCRGGTACMQNLRCVSGARPLAATRSIVDVQPRLTARAASSAPAFRGPTLPPWVFGGVGLAWAWPSASCPAVSPARDLSLVHARSSALWVARAACVYPPLGGGGSMCGICIGVSLRVRPLRETNFEARLGNFTAPPPLLGTVPCGSNARKTSFSTASHAIKCELTRLDLANETETRPRVVRDGGIYTRSCRHALDGPFTLPRRDSCHNRLSSRPTTGRPTTHRAP